MILLKQGYVCGGKNPIAYPDLPFCPLMYQTVDTQNYDSSFELLHPNGFFYRKRHYC